ncbi:hypothetical protein CDAR_300031 [Caerostris darwini]|uniref:Uncharacterized protein n=1 Tax=Caerostris darwini TaxID=1538125 RepID=A0AAV4W6S8_9ARAC|nr:hypothetical protein CDAR_300031 [Caerostris darwini]
MRVFTTKSRAGTFGLETSVSIRWRNAKQRLTATVACELESVLLREGWGGWGAHKFYFAVTLNNSRGRWNSTAVHISSPGIGFECTTFLTSALSGFVPGWVQSSEEFGFNSCREPQQHDTPCKVHGYSSKKAGPE